MASLALIAGRPGPSSLSMRDTSKGEVMGDKGKKDKDKDKKQKASKQNQEEKNKQEKQPKRNPT